MTRQMLLHGSSVSSSKQSSENYDMIEPPVISINQFENFGDKEIDLSAREKIKMYTKQ